MGSSTGISAISSWLRNGTEHEARHHVKRRAAGLLDKKIKAASIAVGRIAANINHACRRINSTGRFCDADVAELKERMADVWELAKAHGAL